MDRKKAIDRLKRWKQNIGIVSEYELGYAEWWVSLEDMEALDMAISSLETDEAYQLEYERITKNDLGVDCISRADAIKGLGEQPYVWTDSDFEIQQLADWKNHKEMLENLPSVTPQEPKMGHWIEDDEQRHVEKTYHCSECGHGAWGEYEKTEYCGGCGAKMVEPQESENKE